MEMMDMAADDTREELRRKLRSNFDGRIVRSPSCARTGAIPLLIW